MADEEPITNPGSGSGSTTASGTGSDSDNSTDSIDLECTASCVAIQWKVQEAFLEGKRVAATTNANPNPNTTVYNNPPGILLDNFNEGWNRGVDNAGLVHTIDFPQVVNAFRSAAYKAGLILESLYDDSPKALPTSDYQELVSAWELAGYYAGTHMMEQYHYEKHLHIATFMDFFTNRKF
ncbi:PREDICTED: uncharacterized protein LOC104723896 [Camelina sativa]|uniref:Uncharacterized protein LOC104723896 n=1 Tax=Camelina sativa TaxID=90675 RepID=A0ABM0UG34_CAMSA|nr:PREDICTED: uncharacterized protein LOC104723896 [Camelina sativa]